MQIAWSFQVGAQNIFKHLICVGISHLKRVVSEGVHQFTEGENMKPFSRKRAIECVLDAWSQLCKGNIKLFKCCHLNYTSDDTEDEFIHCLEKGQSWELEVKYKLTAIDFSWQKWCRKSIHFSLWWRGCQWRNKFDWEWNRWRDYNVDL